MLMSLEPVDIIAPAIETHFDFAAIAFHTFSRDGTLTELAFVFSGAATESKHSVLATA